MAAINKSGVWLIFALIACVYAQQRASDHPAFFNGVGGLTRWKPDCEFEDIAAKKVPSGSSDECGGLCLIDQKCNLFYFNNEICSLIISPDTHVKAIESKGSVCGYIPSRI